MTRKTYGMIAGVAGAVGGALWWWRRRSANPAAAPDRRGQVIYSNTPTPGATDLPKAHPPGASAPI